MRGLMNLIIGACILAGALTGHLVLVITHPQSRYALPAVGGALVLLGIYRMSRRRT